MRTDKVGGVGELASKGKAYGTKCVLDHGSGMEGMEMHLGGCRPVVQTEASSTRLEETLISRDLDMMIELQGSFGLRSSVPFPR